MEEKKHKEHVISFIPVNEGILSNHLNLAVWLFFLILPCGCSCVCLLVLPIALWLCQIDCVLHCAIYIDGF